MIAAAFGNPGHGWLQHFWWWFEIHTGTVNEGGPWYGALSGYWGDLGLLGIFGTSLFHLRHVVKAHQCYETTCHKIATHHYEKDGVVHPVCHHHHPALGPDHRLTDADLREHHRRKTQATAVQGTASSLAESVKAKPPLPPAAVEKVRASVLNVNLCQHCGKANNKARTFCTECHRKIA